MRMKHPKSFDSDELTRKRMGRVRLKGGNAEVALAKELWKRGFRYRKNYKKLPGSPDIALLKYRVAIFVDGEFWHGYDWENKKTRIRRNKEYWIEKIQENIDRDYRVNQELKAMGWIPIRFWSREVVDDVSVCADDIESCIIGLCKD